MNSRSFVRRMAALLVLSTSVPVFAAPAGVLDPTFDGDGKQTIAFNLVGSGDKGANYDAAQAVVAAPGGRFYLVGTVNTGPLIEPLLAHSAVGITRLRFDGTLDSDFGDQGTRVHTLMPNGSSEVRHAVLQPDGKLLIAGWVNDGVDVYARPMVCRFSPDGMKDTEFGDAVLPGCRFFLDVPGSFSAVLVQADGRIVLGGARSVDGLSIATVLRLHPDGSTDTTFGTAGAWMLAGVYDTSGIFALAQRADGRLFAAGYAKDIENNSGGNNTLIVRFDAASGTPDPSFGPDGARVIGVGAGKNYSRRHDVGLDVHPFEDGSALVTGVTATDYSPNSASFSTRPFALKLLATGELDPQFGGGLRVYNPCPVFLYDCAVDAKESGSSFVLDDGRFVIAGTYRYTEDSANFFAMRLLSDGDLDLGFGSKVIGEEATALVDFGLVAPELSLDDAAGTVADGERIVVAGYATTPSIENGADPDRDFAVARLDHGLDQTFFNVSSESFGNGTLSPAEQLSVNHSDHVDFELTPAPGYRIGSVEGCDGALYGKVYTTGPIVADCTVTATFELKPDALFSDGFEPQD